MYSKDEASTLTLYLHERAKERQRDTEKERPF